MAKIDNIIPLYVEEIGTNGIDKNTWKKETSIKKIQIWTLRETLSLPQNSLTHLILVLKLSNSCNRISNE